METAIEYWGIKGLKLMRKAGVTLPTFKDMLPNIDEFKSAPFSIDEIYNAVHSELLKERDTIVERAKKKAAQWEANKKK